MHYLAYGSNLHPLRLIERVPSAEFLFTVELEEYCLLFEKQGQDDSGKCNIRHTGRTTDRVHAAMYQIAAQHKPLLDEFEGLGAGYIDQTLQVHHQGRSVDCFSYIAQTDYIVPDIKPYHWYKSLVLKGAQYLDFPEAYLSSIETVESIRDNDLPRHQAHQELIARMADYSVS